MENITRKKLDNEISQTCSACAFKFQSRSSISISGCRVKDNSSSRCDSDIIWFITAVGVTETGRTDRQALTPLSVQLSAQRPVSNEARSHWNSRSVPLQQDQDRGWREEEVVYIWISCM